MLSGMLQWTSVQSRSVLLHERNWSLGPTIPPPLKNSQGWEASALMSISLVYFLEMEQLAKLGLCYMDKTQLLLSALFLPN